MRMGEKADTQISTISSGSLALDEALGVGGYPRGESLKYMDQKVLVKQRLLYMLLQKYKAMGE